MAVGLAYSPLNSAKLSCLSEVTLVCSLRDRDFWVGWIFSFIQWIHARMENDNLSQFSYKLTRICKKAGKSWRLSQAKNQIRTLFSKMRMIYKKKIFLEFLPFDPPTIYAKNLPSYFPSIFKSPLLKVSKFQKQIFLFSFEPKNEQNCFLISALRI